MADDKAGGFLGRWSRLKREAAQDAAALPGPVLPAEPAASDAAMPPAELPPLESLDFESDYRGFLGARVDEGIKRAALSRLFHAPHFNTMDGLDVYIEDFNVFEPLPASMVAQLAHARETLSPTLPDGWLRPDAPDDGGANEDALSAQPVSEAAVPTAERAPEAGTEDAGGPAQSGLPGGESRSVSE